MRRTRDEIGSGPAAPPHRTLSHTACQRITEMGNRSNELRSLAGRRSRPTCHNAGADLRSLLASSNDRRAALTTVPHCTRHNSPDHPLTFVHCVGRTGWEGRVRRGMQRPRDDARHRRSQARVLQSSYAVSSRVGFCDADNHHRLSSARWPLPLPSLRMPPLILRRCFLLLLRLFPLVMSVCGVVWASGVAAARVTRDPSSFGSSPQTRDTWTRADSQGTPSCEPAASKQRRRPKCQHTRLMPLQVLPPSLKLSPTPRL